MLFYVFIGLSMVVGTVAPFQAVVNGNLNKRVGVWEGTLVNMIVGFIVLCVLTLFIGNGNVFGALDAPLWLLILSGLIGVLMVPTMVVPAPKIGMAMSQLVAVVTSLIVAMIIDQFGLFGLAPKTISIYRIIGLLIMLVGILFNYLGTKSKTPAPAAIAQATQSEAPAKKVNNLPYYLISVANGILTAIFSPINNMLNVYVGHPVQTAVVKFFMSIVCLAVIVLVTRKGDLRLTFKGPKWSLVGGALGTINVTFNMTAIAIIGTVLNTIGLNVGKMVMAIIIDLTGMLGFPKVKVNMFRFLAVVVALLGIVVMNAPGLFGI